MTDNLKPEDRLKTMRAVKAKGTGLERQLFSMLAGMKVGGWRKNVGEVQGKPDVVFYTRLAIFVDGCFWHGCPYCKRKLPETNRQYWERKIGRNIRIAKSTSRKLKRAGWTVIRIWEHEMKNPVARWRIRQRIRRSLKKESHNDA